eukprot:c20807_g3_i1 orf=1623-1883(+)
MTCKVKCVFSSFLNLNRSLLLQATSSAPSSLFNLLIICFPINYQHCPMMYDFFFSMLDKLRGPLYSSNIHLPQCGSLWLRKEVHMA